MKTLTFLALILMMGCGGCKTVHPVACAAKWRDDPDFIFELNENLVGSDQKVYATVNRGHYDAIYSVWHNGAGFGEYVTREAAEKRGEEIACRLGESTFF